MKVSVLNWLLDSDPAIRWQALLDLAEADSVAVVTERAKVAECGWGAELLAQQTEQGSWQGDDLSLLRTLHCLVLLKDMGVDPDSQRVRTMVVRVDQNLRWEWHGNRPFFSGEVEPCINGEVLAVGSYFGINCSVVLARLLGEQLEDGGWNCDAPASTRSSFHTTIAVLEGILAHERSFGATPATLAARGRAEEYLLQRQLFRRLSTGAVIDDEWTRPHFPSTWHYDIVRGLEYFRVANRPFDNRMQQALDLVQLRRHQNGRWPLAKPYQDDRLKFEMETKVGSASRWNTLRAMRVLRRFAPDSL